MHQKTEKKSYEKDFYDSQKIFWRTAKIKNLVVSMYNMYTFEDTKYLQSYNL